MAEMRLEHLRVTIEGPDGGRLTPIQSQAVDTDHEIQFAIDNHEEKGLVIHQAIGDVLRDLLIETDEGYADEEEGVFLTFEQAMNY